MIRGFKRQSVPGLFPPSKDPENEVLNILCYERIILKPNFMQFLCYDNLNSACFRTGDTNFVKPSSQQS